MTEYRYTLLAIRDDGSMTDIARLKCRELAEILLQELSGKYAGVRFELEDQYRPKSLSELLADETEFD